MCAMKYMCGRDATLSVQPHTKSSPPRKWVGRQGVEGLKAVAKCEMASGQSVLPIV